MRSILLLTLVLSLLAPATAVAYGEVDEDGYPSASERAVHFFTDQLRVAPGFSDSQFLSYDPVPPLAYNRDLNEAARFYADDMAENGCFPPDHSSCDGTSFQTRVSSFYSGQPIGENIASGSPTARSVVFDGWLYSEGHRDNMLSSLWNELGTGTPSEGPDLLWVQDFGGAGFSGTPITTSGTHYPLDPDSAEGVDFFLAVHDPEGQPSGADLIFDGLCYPMDDDRGSAGMQTYSAHVQSGAERCAPYFMKLTRLDGEVVYYPTTGALVVPVRRDDCPEWTEDRPSSDCAPVDEDGPGPGLVGDGQGCGDPSGGPNASTGAEETSYGSCSVSTRQARSAPGFLAASLLFCLARRRRRPDGAGS